MGDLDIRLQGARYSVDTRSSRAPSLLRSIRNTVTGITPDVSRPSLEKLVVRLIDLVRMRIREYPRDLTFLHLSGPICIRYHQGHCRLRLPVNVSPWKDKISTEVVDALCTFFREIPITHLSYHPAVIDPNGDLRQFEDPQLCEAILQSPIIDTLTTLTIFSGPLILFSTISGSRQVVIRRISPVPSSTPHLPTPDQVYPMLRTPPH